jgi:hypothetical protein
MQEKTIFQKIIDREIPATIVYEDEKLCAFLDINPIQKGHVLLVPKEPYQIDSLICLFERKKAFISNRKQITRRKNTSG